MPPPGLTAVLFSTCPSVRPSVRPFITKLVNTIFSKRMDRFLCIFAQVEIVYIRLESTLMKAFIFHLKCMLVFSLSSVLCSHIFIFMPKYNKNKTETRKASRPKGVKNDASASSTIRRPRVMLSF